MTHQNQSTAFDGVVQLLAEHGFDGMAEAIVILMNEAMKLQRDLEPTLAQTSPHVRIEWLTADAGYDSESNHRHCRQQQGIRSLIPPKHGRPTDKPAKGRYRRRMQTHFDHQRYGQRWQVENVVSMLKRRLGSAT